VENFYFIDYQFIMLEYFLREIFYGGICVAVIGLTGMGKFKEFWNLIGLD
jgi:hypothetical protein